MTPVQSVEPHFPEGRCDICAHNVGRQIASPACRAIPGVDLLIVIDDGSDDDTGWLRAPPMRLSFAICLPRPGSARETAKVAAMYRVDAPGRHILFLSLETWGRVPSMPPSLSR